MSHALTIAVIAMLLSACGPQPRVSALRDLLLGVRVGDRRTAVIQKLEAHEGWAIVGNPEGKFIRAAHPHRLQRLTIMFRNDTVADVSRQWRHAGPDMQPSKVLADSIKRVLVEELGPTSERGIALTWHKRSPGADRIVAFGHMCTALVPSIEDTCSIAVAEIGVRE